MGKEALIEIKVILDENNIPNEIIWNAEDGGIQNQKTDSVLISIWNKEKSEALRLDLWTKEMTIDNMNRFFYQIFISLSNTYQVATGEKNLSSFIKDFAENFAKESSIKI